jgi:hypothetical protein
VRHPIPRYTSLAFSLNGLLDQGVSISIEDAKSRIRDGSLLDWLEEQYGGEPYYFDVSLYDGDERQKICASFEQLADNVDEGRKLAVRHNGIALGVAYCLEILQHPTATPSSPWTGHRGVRASDRRR